jgi:hypothetical protein
LKEENLLRVFKNGMLRKIIGSRWDEVARQWRILHKDELYDLYSSAKINRVIKSERLRWEGHVARMGDRIDVQSTVFVRDLMERRELQELGVGGRIILQWIFKM